jgi:hypothetical protein
LEYANTLDTLPTLVRRMLVEDNNNIGELEKYLDQFHQHEGMKENDLIVFGQDLGDGSKNRHLRLGFTSLKLIKLINKFGNNGVW